MSIADTAPAQLIVTPTLRRGKIMFSIHLQIQAAHFQGLKAVDFFRRLGLPENSSASTAHGSGNQYGAQDVYAPVSEAFARAYFAENIAESFAIVPVEFLVAGDARMACAGNYYAVTLANLSPERAKELYLAVRFAACRAQVGRLTAEVEELRAQLPKSDDSDDDED